MCARIHLHVPLRAADTHAYPYGYGAFDCVTNSDVITYINCDSDRDRNAKTHTNSEIESNAALSPQPKTSAMTTL